MGLVYKVFEDASFASDACRARGACSPTGRPLRIG